MSVPSVSSRLRSAGVASGSIPAQQSGDRAPAQHATVTCARDGLSHSVPHAVLAESLASGTGQLSAVCGHLVLPASLASPPGSHCPLCTAAVEPPRREPRRRMWR
ncbi:hypothetical protein [Pseudonocardia phyllosphaerae]|uniref:hypothetical protein n=1 Tax=Pseudonocardia phyllosphaerae TaxID=3390502 RepID=UPI003979C031